LERAVAAQPNLPVAWFHLGEVRTARGRLEQAIPCYRRALEIDPSSITPLLRADTRRGHHVE
jgi:cytochrome c-type biogenesis protein CcmH/NrfG